MRTGVPGFGWAVLAGAALLLASGDAAFAGALPKAVNAEMLAGYDSNILDASDAEIRAFETHDPSSYFVVEHMEDATLQITADARWGLGRTDMRLRYGRLQYVREDIRSENHYSALWRRRMAPSTEAALSVEFAPNVYGRHRRDKDALPGDPVFRPEVRDEWDAALQVLQEMHPGLSSQLIVEGSIRDYVEQFDERDRWRLGGRTGLVWRPSEDTRLDVSGGYRRLRSRNDPYLGSDLSYRSWIVRSALDWAVFARFLRMRAYVNHDWRTYTSSDPDDGSHYGRHDRVWELGGLLLHSFSPSFDWKATMTHIRRSASSAFDATGDLDEQGSVRDTFVSTGIAWHWKR